MFRKHNQSNPLQVPFHKKHMKEEWQTLPYIFGHFAVQMETKHRA